jgi:DNA-binding transcriptional regulator YhcF (GntR family)
MRKAERDLSIGEIATASGIHRNTVSKYIYALERESKITMTRQVGNAKLYSVRSKG